MTFVITGTCINDTSCVTVCPVNCIHPAPEDPGYQNAEMLYIDPDVCIECGACMDACPVSAIFPSYDLPDSLSEFEEINARYFADPAHKGYEQKANAPVARSIESDFQQTLRVAIIGSGPSACYAAEDLLTTRGIKISVDMFESLPAPFGLVRYGVAPDHQSTKTVTNLFGSLFRRKNFRLFLNTKIGKDVQHEQLTARYHAVLYASGASVSQNLNIPGANTPGSHTATDFVGWYNSHPEHSDKKFNLDTERVVIIGNGNVAIDIARQLVMQESQLQKSDMADYAINAISSAPIKEVVVVGRRGPNEAAFTTPELMGLMREEGIAIEVEGAELDPAKAPNDIVAQKITKLIEAVNRPSSPEQHRIIFRFLNSPIEIVGEGQVTGIKLSKNILVEKDGSVSVVQTAEEELLETGLILRAVGHRGAAMPWLPFDEEQGTIKNLAGRVEIEDPVYVAGWIKRGSSGVIGTNRICSGETVDSLFKDVLSGRIADSSPAELADIAELIPDALDAGDWKKIDREEKKNGKALGKPRQKFFTIEEMLNAANK